MKDQIKVSRKRIDAILRLTKQMQDTREFYKGYDNLQLAFMRLGKLLGTLGTPNPYPESSNPDSRVIEPPADVAETTLEIPEGYDHVATVKFIRQQIDIETHTLLQTFLDYYEDTEDKLPHAALIVLDVLRDSKMWYGCVLNSIREGEIRYQEFLKDNEEKMWAQVEDAYRRYGAVTDFKNFKGDPMPEFKDLPDTIRKAWFEAVRPNDKTRDMYIG